MEQPAIPGLPSSTSTGNPPLPPPLSDPSLLGSKTNDNGKAAARKPSPPTPEELVAHYEAQGLDPREASMRVIRELQTVLYRTLASGRGRKDRFMADTGRKLDNANTRLAIVEMKIDSKPGYPESIAIAVTAGAAVHGIRSAVPLVLGAFGKMWEAVSSASKGHSPPP